MPGKIRKTSARTDAELKIQVIDALQNADDSVMPTIDWIKQQNPMMLGGYSTQKLSRILGSLVDLGFVRKGKSRSLGRMVYRLTAKMKEDGYEVDEDIKDETGFGVIQRSWNGVSWDAEDEIRCE